MRGVSRSMAATVTLILALSGCAGGEGSKEAPSPLASPQSTSGDGPTSSSPATASATVKPDAARFEGSVRRVHGPIRTYLLKKNWHEGCPVPLRDLRVVTVSYWGFDGEVKSGPLVLNEMVADDVLWVFGRLFRHGFPIKRIALAAKYHPPRPSDYHSHRDVTASFNCRPVTDNPGALSQHSYGWAIDINPLQNPYVRGDGSVLRRPALAYVDRLQDLPGMIHPGDVVVRSFARIGWEWGGDFSSIKDYMHFSLTGK
jgi:hypothetical protein